MALREYKARRNFRVTREPPARPRAISAGHAPLFVIQKHAASHLHYDFRIELAGVLKSWAVPKGPPYAHEEKRLAMQVEDHPYEYARFEGIIPEGEYGGGTVMVWDIGAWEPLTDDPAGDLGRGKLHFRLRGRKLEGEWRLVRMHGRGKGNEWLLIRNGPGIKPLSKKQDDQSALSGRTMAAIAREHDAEWRSEPAGKPKPARTPPGMKKRPDLAKRFIVPMMARLSSGPPAGDWEFEIKWDGYRALGIRAGGAVMIRSRNDKDFTTRFPVMAEALLGLRCKSAIVDGEIVALDEQGRSSFQLLQDYEQSHAPLAYYLFDLLELDGRDLTGLPLVERKARLAALLPEPGPILRLSPALSGAYDQLLAQVRKLGIEGLVGKRGDSRYEPGRRSGAWIKIKILNEQEFVIGGYTPPGGSRKFFGALLIGYYEKGRLLFASKVGTGFTRAALRDLHARLQPLQVGECPFANLPVSRHGRWGQGITRAEMKECVWVKPKLVAQVRFTAWTKDRGLRHPAYQGLREDKEAIEVTRETSKNPEYP